MEVQTVYRNKDGVRRTMISEQGSEIITVKTEVDMTLLVDNNRVLAEQHPDRSTNKLVARVPMTVYEQSIIEDWDDAQWKKWLNDPDNKAFRVWPGQV